MLRRTIALLVFLPFACDDSPSTNNACVLYREIDKASSCVPLKQGIGSNSSDTAIVRYAGGAGSKWCMTILDPHPLVCTTIHPSPAELEADLAAAKAIVVAPHDAGIAQDAPLGPPFTSHP